MTNLEPLRNVECSDMLNLENNFSKQERDIPSQWYHVGGNPVNDFPLLTKKGFKVFPEYVECYCSPFEDKEDILNKVTKQIPTEAERKSISLVSKIYDHVPHKESLPNIAKTQAYIQYILRLTQENKLNDLMSYFKTNSEFIDLLASSEMIIPYQEDLESISSKFNERNFIQLYKYADKLYSFLNNSKNQPLPQRLGKTVSGLEKLSKQLSTIEYFSNKKNMAFEVNFKGYYKTYLFKKFHETPDNFHFEVELKINDQLLMSALEEILLAKNESEKKIKKDLSQEKAIFGKTSIRSNLYEINYGERRVVHNSDYLYCAQENHENFIDNLYRHIRESINENMNWYNLNPFINKYDIKGNFLISPTEKNPVINVIIKKDKQNIISNKKIKESIKSNVVYAFFRDKDLNERLCQNNLYLFHEFLMPTIRSFENTYYALNALAGYVKSNYAV